MRTNQRVKRVLRGYPTRVGVIKRIEGVQHFVLWDDEVKGVLNFFTNKIEPANPMPYLSSEIKPA